MTTDYIEALESEVDVWKRDCEKLNAEIERLERELRIVGEYRGVAFRQGIRIKELESENQATQKELDIRNETCRIAFNKVEELLQKVKELEAENKQIDLVGSYYRDDYVQSLVDERKELEARNKELEGSLEKIADRYKNIPDSFVANLCKQALKGEKTNTDIIEDGFGSSWSAYCAMCGKKSMHVARPGKVQCSFCG